MEYFIPWLILSIVVGAIGSSRNIGFAGAFFLSLVLSPLIGIIITMLSKSIEEEKYKKEILKTQKQQREELSTLNDSVKKNNITDELIKLKGLLEEGLLTKEEFQLAKEKILNNQEINVDNKIANQKEVKQGQNESEIIANLKDLVNEGVISTDEYNIKLNEINKNKELQSEKEIEANINKYAQLIAQPQVEKLSGLVDSGNLSKEEFNTKVESLMGEKIDEIGMRMDKINSNDYSIFHKKDIKDLDNIDIMWLNRATKKMENGNVVLQLKNAKSFHIFNNKQLIDIYVSGKLDDYWFLEGV